MTIMKKIKFTTMAINEHLADRVRQVFKEKNTAFFEKKMFGGLCFMVDDKMCCGITSKGEFMARVGPEIYDKALAQEHINEMKFTGKAMRGFVFVGEDAIDMEDDLAYWVQLCLDYNPLAKKSKKKK